MAKERYCCSNHKSKLPGLFDDIAGRARRNLVASVKNEPNERQQISMELKAAAVLPALRWAICSTRLKSAAPA